MPDEPSHPSGAAVPHPNLSVLHNNRNPAVAAGEREHLLELGRVFLHIHVLRVPIGRPGLIGIGSTRLSEDNDPLRHDVPPLGYSVYAYNIQSI